MTPNPVSSVHLRRKKNLLRTAFLRLYRALDLFPCLSRALSRLSNDCNVGCRDPPPSIRTVALYPKSYGVHIHFPPSRAPLPGLRSIDLHSTLGIPVKRTSPVLHHGSYSSIPTPSTFGTYLPDPVVRHLSPTDPSPHLGRADSVYPFPCPTA